MLNIFRFQIKYTIAAIIFSLIVIHIQAEEIQEKQLAVEMQYQITEVHYQIKGITRVYPLSQAVPIDQTIVFSSFDALMQYLKKLETDFENIRVLQETNIAVQYEAPTLDNVVPVILTINTVDTWNVIVVPYPSFDSNSGFQVKLKVQDFNFAGWLQPIKADVVYRLTENNQSIFSSSLQFIFPFRVKSFDMLWGTDAHILYAAKTVPKLNLTGDLQASYTYNKYFRICFGLSNSLIINDRYTMEPASVELLKEKVSKTQPKPSEDVHQEYTEVHTETEKDIEDKSSQTHSQKTQPQFTEQYVPDPLGSVYSQDRYYFTTRLYMFTPVTIVAVKHFGSLIWTPSISLGGNWAFDGIQADALKSLSFGWGHALTLGHIDWISNFRQGLSFSLGNNYSFDPYRNQKMNISFDTSIAGYYSFINRIGIYSRVQFFYQLFNRSTTYAGATVRGILNRRIDTDTALMFNLDIPIRIASLDFQEITDVSWTRFLNCEIHAAPFIDAAWGHDKKTNRYYHPADGWYAGGIEITVFPEKMRSIYIRASAGFDLSELKNVPGINKIGGKAKRDGEAISEIFIGIGFHY